MLASNRQIRTRKVGVHANSVVEHLHALGKHAVPQHAVRTLFCILQAIEHVLHPIQRCRSIPIASFVMGYSPAFLISMSVSLYGIMGPNIMS